MGDDDDDFGHLVSLLDGIEIITVPGFQANKAPLPLRPKYLAVKSCINKMLYEQHAAGSILLLSTEVAKSIPDIHYSTVSWTPKPNVKKGRLLGDPSNSSPGLSVLNADGIKPLLKNKWVPFRTPDS